MCYRFTTPLRRRPAHGFAFRQAETLDAFAGSSFSAATRATGLASEERGQPPGSRFRVPASRNALCVCRLLLFGRDPRNRARVRGTGSVARLTVSRSGKPAHGFASPQAGKTAGLGCFPIPPFVGWVKGLEPSTPGTTIRCSNQLSYTHHRENGTPEGTRTPGLLLRRQLLYPTELLAHMP